MSAFLKIKSDMDNIRAEYESKIKPKYEEARTLIETELARMFQEKPVITSIWWTQYCPSFNDGDRCYFSVGDIFMSTADDEEIYISKFSAKEDQQLYPSGIFELKNFIHTNDEMMEFLYGDGYKVIATKGGITLEEYHDY